MNHGAGDVVVKAYPALSSWSFHNVHCKVYLVTVCRRNLRIMFSITEMVAEHARHYDTHFSLDTMSWKPQKLQFPQKLGPFHAVTRSEGVHLPVAVVGASSTLRDPARVFSGARLVQACQRSVAVFCEPASRSFRREPCRKIILRRRRIGWSISRRSHCDSMVEPIVHENFHPQRHVVSAFGC